MGARNSSQKDEFFTKGKNEKLDKDYISHSYFVLPRRSIRNNSDKKVLFKQTLRDVDSMYKDIAGYDMKYDEFKEMCRKTWSEKFNYLYNILSRKKECNHRIFNVSRNTYKECIPEIEAF